MIQSLIAHARRQIDQVERRLLKGETIAHDEKVFSIFEEHTRWVSKGKAGCAVELGVPVCVVEDQFQFILHHKILWEGSDTDIAVSIINETQALHRDLRVCSFDRGFHSPGNRGQLDAMLDLNALPRKGRLSVAERERDEAKHLPRPGAMHAAVESAIRQPRAASSRPGSRRSAHDETHRCIVDFRANLHRMGLRATAHA